MVDRGSLGPVGAEAAALGWAGVVSRPRHPNRQPSDMPRSVTCALAFVLTLVPAAVRAQTRFFVVRLGVDTFAVERVVRTGDRVEGAVARHTPSATILRYTVHFNPDSSIASHEESIYNPDGSAVAPAQGVAQTAMRMRFRGDTVIREVMENDQRVVKRDVSAGLTLPSIGGNSPYWQELALQAVRRRHADQFGFFGFGLAQTTPNTFGVRFVSADSAEILFPQGFRRGYRMDRSGRLLHGDGTNTTVRLQIKPVREADVDATARAWAAQEAIGHGMPLASPRDSVVTRVGDAAVTIDYGSPAKRGRRIWGALVPFDTVWRLGANLPTQLRTDKDLIIGNATVPAGSYSLWLVPSTTRPYLLANTQTSGWVGVPMHDASRDLVKIPVRPHSGASRGGEGLRISIEDGRLAMLWDDGGYDVSIKARGDR